MNIKEIETTDNVKKLEKEIKDYLKQKKPEYFEGVELYSQHPHAKRPLIVNFHNRWRKKTMHEKIIYELEKLVGAKTSLRRTVLEHSQKNVSYKFVEKIETASPKNFKYKVHFKQLPKKLQELAVEKGQIYNSLNENKRRMAEIGDVNDDKSLSKREAIYKEMKHQAEKIKRIHSLLSKYEEGAKIDDDEIAGINQIHAGIAEKQGKKKKIEPESELQQEFKYKEMDYYQRKDLLKKLRSSVPRQEKRAEESKKKSVIDRNKAKAELGRKMIAILEKYFDENEAPE